MFTWGLRQLRKVVVFIVGASVLLFGVALVVLPGPAFIVIPLGLAILALEFAWARQWLKSGQSFLIKMKEKATRRTQSPPSKDLSSDLPR